MCYSVTGNIDINKNNEGKNKLEMDIFNHFISSIQQKYSKSIDSGVQLEITFPNSWRKH